METMGDSELSGNGGREPTVIHQISRFPPPFRPHTITAVDRKSVPPLPTIHNGIDINRLRAIINKIPVHFPMPQSDQSHVD